MTGKLKVLGIASSAKSGRAIRTKKYIQPECVVYETHAGEKVAVSGPCKKRPGWWETCTHGGPTAEELTAAGWGSFNPAYFEKSYRDITTDTLGEKTEDGDVTVTGTTTVRALVIRPRVTQVSASVRNSSGSGPAIAEILGFKRPEEFGIAPFCEYLDCYEQNPAQRRNGLFCSELHAKLVKNDEEHDEFLAIDFGPDGRKRRSAQLAGIEV